MLVKWLNYSKKINSWEPATLLNDDAYKLLRQELIKNIGNLPDLNSPPTKKQRTKNKSKKNKSFTIVIKPCPYAANHKSRDLSKKIEGLHEESRKAYIGEGYFLHNNICHKCKKTFVLNISDSTKQLTVSIKSPAWHCPNASSGCKYVLCDSCHKVTLLESMK